MQILLRQFRSTLPHYPAIKEFLKSIQKKKRLLSQTNHTIPVFVNPQKDPKSEILRLSLNKANLLQVYIFSKVTNVELLKAEGSKIGVQGEPNPSQNLMKIIKKGAMPTKTVANPSLMQSFPKTEANEEVQKVNLSSSTNLGELKKPIAAQMQGSTGPAISLSNLKKKKVGAVPTSLFE
mgnify:FL=1